MSAALFSRNEDLKRLRDEGYDVQIINGNLIMNGVPYVNAAREVKRGRLLSSLTLAGDCTQKPDTHVVNFDGQFPCDRNGQPIRGIGGIPANLMLDTQHMFSSKPSQSGYENYFDKMTTYAAILSGQAAVLDPGVSPRIYRQPDEEENSVFQYVESASSRVGIGALTARLAEEHIAIIGVGGTGSYVLDLIAKTPVREIRLFDDDDLLQHNAFRAPGAPTIDQLRGRPKKVEHFASQYSNMHRHITPHAIRLDENSIHLLEGVTFAFLCIDAGSAKRVIIDKLELLGVPFIDVGMGLELVDGSLGGILRVTVSTPSKRDHINQRISFGQSDAENLYASNIQVADLNMLNASLAVGKWKKLRRFYRDLENEHHCTYTTDGNLLVNGDQA